MNRIKANPELKYLTLLYVEDEASIREPFELMVGRFFKKIYIGTNGEEGLELFRKHNEEIDIVISDIKMPIMTGLVMAKEIKEINYEVPIIFTTAFDDSNYLKEAIEVGADGYIIKPIDRNKVIERLNVLSKSIIAKKEVYKYLELIKTLINYQRDGLILLDENFNIKIMNQAFQAILKEANITEAKNIEDLLDYCMLENGEKLTKQNFIENIGQKFICQGNQTYKFFDVDIRKVNNYILVNLNDITEYKLTAEKIKEDAMIDELTQLYNRKKLDVLKQKLIDNNVCFIIFDIDNFKKINDTYGHLKGDEVLQYLAKTVQNNLRGSDVVIRWGGEEFLVILQGVHKIDVAQELSEKLRQKINEIYIEEVGHFSCSFGVVCGFVQKETDLEKYLEQADEALYLAKRNGKNRVEIYKHNIN